MGECSNFYRPGSENTANPDDLENEPGRENELLGCDTTGADANPDSFDMSRDMGIAQKGSLPSLRQAIETALSLLVLPEPQGNLNCFNPVSGAPPIKWIGQGSHIIYGSAIALHTTQPDQAMPLAEAIAAQFHQLFHQLMIQTASWSARLAQEWTIFPVPPGFLHFHLSDRGTALWLQTVVDWEAPLPSRSTIPAPPDVLFQIQATHARCCTLLRQAHQAGLVTLKSEHSTPEMLDPHPLPWTNPTLSLQHSTEQSLIECLLTTLDTLPSPKAPLKGAIALSQRFQDFHAACRLFDETRRSNPALVQARLGLTLATQKVLKFLLETTNTEAPLTL